MSAVAAFAAAVIAVLPPCDFHLDAVAKKVLSRSVVQKRNQSLSPSGIAVSNRIRFLFKCSNSFCCLRFCNVRFLLNFFIECKIFADSNRSQTKLVTA